MPLNPEIINFNVCCLPAGDHYLQCASHMVEIGSAQCYIIFWQGCFGHLVTILSISHLVTSYMLLLSDKPLVDSEVGRFGNLQIYFRLITFVSKCK